MLGRHRGDLRLGELPHHVTQHQVVIFEVEVKRGHPGPFPSELANGQRAAAGAAEKRGRRPLNAARLKVILQSGQRKLRRS